MSNILEQSMKLHEEAMNFSEKAQVARIREQKRNSTILFREAFRLEKKAAMLLKDEKVNLVTRAVLFRSAAVLALDCGEINEAEELIHLGLLGGVPPQIADELQDLKKEIESDRCTEPRRANLPPKHTRVSSIVSMVYSEHSEETLVAEEIIRMYLKVEKDLQDQTFENARKIAPYTLGSKIPNFLSLS